MAFVCSAAAIIPKITKGYNTQRVSKSMLRLPGSNFVSEILADAAPMSEGVKLLNLVRDIYLDSNITVAGLQLLLVPPSRAWHNFRGLNFCLAFDRLYFPLHLPGGVDVKPTAFVYRVADDDPTVDHFCAAGDF